MEMTSALRKSRVEINIIVGINNIGAGKSAEQIIQEMEKLKQLTIYLPKVVRGEVDLLKYLRTAQRLHQLSSRQETIVYLSKVPAYSTSY